MVRCLSSRRRVCDLGSRTVDGGMGSARDLFPTARYVGVDIAPGPGVDVVSNAAVWTPDPAELFDTVISTETLEHTPDAASICLNAFNLLENGGVFMVTASSVGCPPHSGVDGGPLRHGEFYRNVSPFLMRKWLNPFR